MGSLVGGTAYYIAAQRNALIALKSRVDQFKTNNFTELQEHPLLFQPLDKLYLMHSVGKGELHDHRAIISKITSIREAANKLLDSSNRFRGANWRFFYRVVDIAWFDQKASDIEGVIHTIHSVLDYVHQLNRGLLYFKQHLYDKAERITQDALKALNEHNDPAIALPRLSTQYLKGHTYNLAAKIARCQDRLDQADLYYEQALLHSPDDLKIRFSQIALWGDMSWKALASDLANVTRIRQLLKDEHGEEWSAGPVCKHSLRNAIKITIVLALPTSVGSIFKPQLT